MTLLSLVKLCFALAFFFNQWKTQQRETSIYWWSYYVASTNNQFFRIYTEKVRFWVKFYLVVRKVELLVRLWEKCQNSKSHCETVRVGNYGTVRKRQGLQGSARWESITQLYYWCSLCIAMARPGILPFIPSYGHALHWRQSLCTDLL